MRPCAPGRPRLALPVLLPVLIASAGSAGLASAGLASAGGGPPVSAQRGAPRRALERIELVCVVDGDTLDVQRASGPERLRLVNVDTEERLHAGPNPTRGGPRTVFGEETALWLEELLAGPVGADDPVELGLLLPTGEEERDVYGRLLAHVVLPDGRDLNVLLVRLGRSPYFVRYGHSRVDRSAFERAQRVARARRLGIWNPATNRPATRGAPRAGRDYETLLQAWEARAGAIDAWRAARAADPDGVIAADRPGELQRAARAERDVRVFGEVVSARDLDDGALWLGLRSAPGGPRCSVLVPARVRRAFPRTGPVARSVAEVPTLVWAIGQVRPAGEGYRVVLVGRDRLVPALPGAGRPAAAPGRAVKALPPRGR